MYYAGLVILGFVVGVLSGLFGIGGGFFLVPMLNAVFNVPYNIAIGSSLVPDGRYIYRRKRKTSRLRTYRL